MKKVATLHHINFTKTERQLLSSIINRYGDGQHPVADETNIDGFAVSYVKDIVVRKEFIANQLNLSKLGKITLESINAKL